MKERKREGFSIMRVGSEVGLGQIVISSFLAFSPALPHRSRCVQLVFQLLGVAQAQECCVIFNWNLPKSSRAGGSKGR